MRRRHTTDAERTEFADAFKEARPVHAKALVEPTDVKRKANSGGGLDGNTADRLRKGTLEPDARIDLHGRTEEAAHRALLGFLRSVQRSGARLVLVITGKGARQRGSDEPFDMDEARRSRGVLKSAVPRWLAEPAFAALIADSRSAHRKHGGAGALYVYLKKWR
jgi:DNA-nicking Smr family endonuclease